MRVLGIDTETSHKEPQQANLLEVGAVVFDVHEGVWTAIEGVNHLVYYPRYSPIPQEALDVNGLSEELLKRDGVTMDVAVRDISAMLDRYPDLELVVAHNASFDKAVIEKNLVDNVLHSRLTMLNWICSLEHIEAVVPRKCKKLSHLALDFGVAVNPEDLHRAMNDVALMGKLLTALAADPVKMLEYKNTPTVVISPKGKVKGPWEDGGKDNAEVKALGYGWERIGDKVYSKRWVKKVKINKLSLETREYEVLEELPCN